MFRMSKEYQNIKKINLSKPITDMYYCQKITLTGTKSDRTELLPGFWV